jgi:hypothetical protein
MAVTIVCQFVALRYVDPQFRWRFRRSIRKWDFENAREIIGPEGYPWLDRIQNLLRAGLVLLGICAFIAVGIIVFGPQLVGPAQ